MKKTRLDLAMVSRRLVATRSQAENYIRLGKVLVDGRPLKKPGYFVVDTARIQLQAEDQYVSRAALKLASVADGLKLDFKHKMVLDVGSSTGGFTDYALRHGAAKVVAVDVGTDQLHPSLRPNTRLMLFEKKNILDFFMTELTLVDNDPKLATINQFDIVLVDVSFVSLRKLLPHIRDNLAVAQTQIVAMLKPQFEAGAGQLSRGVVKNSAQRRMILAGFEDWCRQNHFVIRAKQDSQVAGAKGNVERFYLLAVEVVSRRVGQVRS